MALTGSAPKDNYLDLLYLDNSNAGLPASTPQILKDGGDNATLLGLSQDEIEFAGILSAKVSTGVVLDATVPLTADELIADKLTYKTDTDVAIHFVTGTPEGAVTASPGSLALRTDGGAGTSAYIKESGTSNTGWVAMDVSGSGGTFLGLSDTPDPYLSGRIVAVNSAANALEYIVKDWISEPATPAQGEVLYYDGSDWASLGVGTAGYVLTTQGAGADPTWEAVADASAIPAPAGAAQGEILFYNGSAWDNLGVGTSGQVLKTQGAGSNPIWADESGGSGLPSGVQGNVLYHNGSSWVALAVGTDGQVLTSGGAGANVAWEDIGSLPSSEIADGDIVYYDDDTSSWVNLGLGTAGDVLTVGSGQPTWSALETLPTASSQGDILYHSGSAWAALSAGTVGQVLTSGGAAANPTWEDAASGGGKAYTTAEYDTGDTYKGIPVYAVVVDFGTGPNATTKSVASGLGVNDVFHVIDVQVSANTASEGWVGREDDSVTANAKASFTYNKLDYKIYCTSDSDLSGVSYQVLLKYIKEPTTTAAVGSGTPQIIATISGGSWGGLSEGVHLLTPSNYEFSYGGTYSAPTNLVLNWAWSTTSPSFYKVALEANFNGSTRSSAVNFYYYTGTSTGQNGDSWVTTSPTGAYAKGIGIGDWGFKEYTVDGKTITISRASNFPLKPETAST
jgi:hypothetical protein